MAKDVKALPAFEGNSGGGTGEPQDGQSHPGA
jgi:hypothetical protein